jgi:hypothetical protein
MSAHSLNELVMRPPNSTTPMTPDEIAKLRHDFEELASQLTRVWTETEKPIKADFPKGIIRTIASCHKRYPYISSSRRRTLACVLQLCDINRWNLNMWRIGLTAGTVWEWHCAILIRGCKLYSVKGFSLALHAPLGAAQ